jgi:3D (Asp-Asp-Asp) domain-containing protein
MEQVKLGIRHLLIAIVILGCPFSAYAADTTVGFALCLGCGSQANGSSGSCNLGDFVPAGNTLKRLTIERPIAHDSIFDLFAVVTASLNEVQIGSPVTVTNLGGCFTFTFDTYSFDSGVVTSGVPGYVPGGTNVITFQVTGGDVEWSGGSATITYGPTERHVVMHGGAKPPVITTLRPVQSGCVAYDYDFSGTLLSAAAQPQAGVALSFVSNRTATVDFVNAVTASTDGAGVEQGHLWTRKQGSAQLIEQTIPTPAPLTVLFGEADFVDPFSVTGYYTPYEGDFNGPTTTNPCGLTGTFNDHFLRVVRTEGSGRSLGGLGIQFDTSASRHQPNPCFTVTQCPLTASGTCAQAGVTIAVDKTVIPMGANVLMSQSGSRHAEDTGGAIVGKHIDLYVGYGNQVYRTWLHNIGTHDENVRYLNGGGSCN